MLRFGSRDDLVARVARPDEERHLGPLITAALDERLCELLLALAHLVDAGAEAASRQEQGTRVDDGDDEQ